MPAASGAVPGRVSLLLLLAPLAVQEPGLRPLPIDAGAVPVSVAGSGSPIVIVPGLVGAAWGYRAIAPRLAAAGHRVAVIDPLGAGSLLLPDTADFSFGGNAARLGAAMDSLRLGGAILVCHALGASVCFRLAAERHDLVSGVLSINGGAAEHATTPGLRLALRFAGLLRLFGGRDYARNRLRESLIGSSGDPAWVTEELLDGYTAHYGDDPGAALRSLRRLASAAEPDSLAPLLRRVPQCVVLLVGAASTRALRPEEIAHLRASLPRLRVDSIAGAGQYIHEEQPDAVLVRILALRASGDGTGSVAAASDAGGGDSTACR